MRRMPADPDPGLVEELDHRVELLQQFFDLSRLEGGGNTPAKIRKYYEDSRIGYRLVHSKEGAMHMALNPEGQFDRAGYEGQANLIEARLPPSAVDILELACGNGYNLSLLARRHPDLVFLGLDLVEVQVDRANAVLGDLAKAHAIVGDFQALDLADASFDCVFVIESFCHATDLPKAFGEVKRILRPGGSFIVIDAWKSDTFPDFPPDVQETAINVERAMAVAQSQQIGVWIRTAAENGMRVVEDLDLTTQIVPNLERLARIVETRFLSHPLRARLIKLLVNDTLMTNAVSGYLMPITVGLGLHTYRLVMLEHA
jgi:ubiquinone/menaquinone biosynthesis C-methylase UbiE